MAAVTQRTVVGVFTTTQAARDATQALKKAGFLESEIGVVSSHGQHDGSDDESRVAEGAVAGATTGLGIGALWGLGILAGVLPAIGPAIAGGTLAVLLSSAAAGAATAGLAGALIGMGLSKNEADFYDAEVQAGRTIVTVEAGQRYAEATKILRQAGGYDMTDKSDAGTSRTAEENAPPRQATRDQQTRATLGGQLGKTVRAHEEELQVNKTPVQTGEVRVRKEVHTEHQHLDVPVMREEVVIERRPTNRQQVSATDLDRQEEIRIPVREEQVKVQKQTVVAEEVSVGKRQVQDTAQVNESLRKEEIKVDTEGNPKIRKR